MKKAVKEAAEQVLWRSPRDTFVASPTFAVAAAVPGVALAADLSLEALAKKLAPIGASLPVRFDGRRVTLAGVVQSGAFVATQVGDDEAWVVNVDRDGTAQAVYFHAWLRPAVLPHERKPQPTWPLRQRERFVTAAARAVEAGLMEAAEASKHDFTRDVFIGLAVPKRGQDRQSRDRGRLQPIVLVTRWKKPHVFGPTVRDALAELDRVRHRPFEGYPPYKTGTLHLGAKRQ